MNLLRVSRSFHKWVSLVIGLQIILWISGGVVMSIIPFQPIIKAKAFYTEGDAVDLTTLEATYPVQDVLSNYADISALSLTQVYGKAVYEITGKEGKRFVDAYTGTLLPKPDAQAIKSIAEKAYTGEGILTDIQLIAEPEYRFFGLIDELYGRTDVWRASFNDTLNTRLYFDAHTGQFWKARNDAWVLYDIFWRLHVMDYSEGENFNNSLLRLSAIAAFIATLTGGLLLYYTVLRPKIRRLRASKA